ncbi:hypothetical protein QBC43DRAFT_212382 [Cladorrhinum sp. PSN259]|nr:hypothetical protein QBC43DRAFT_212382 [Cladorrhinum sp. PSN259]
MEQENARIRQELRDQRANLETVEAQRLEIARLQTSLSRAEATVEAELENQHAKLTEHYTSQQSRLDEELRQLKLDKLSLEQEIDTLGQRWQNEQQALVNNYDAQLQAQEAAYQAQFQSLQQQLHQHYQAQVEDAGRLCDQSLRERDELHRQHTSELLERITSLESSLVDNSDDFRPATDDSLRNKYQSLKLTIDTITFNLGTITFRRGTTLDPGGFLEREGKGEEVYLLRSIFWERLQQGFFSLPFGLGALGSGDGKKKLLDMYVAYRRLSGIEPPLAVPQSVEQDCLTVFRTDKDANKWRSSAFQTIGSAVISKKGKPTAELDKEKHAPYFQNRDQVLNSIKEVLGEVCGGVSEDMEDAVTNLVHNAAELAVELGAQRAELGFESPLWGSSVQIGRGFIDCIDDDTYRDELKTVALAVSPKFYKTGDGRHDLTTTKLISQGTIFSARD